LHRCRTVPVVRKHEVRKSFESHVVLIVGALCWLD
jgi:hypothetical protein